jgi:hypothetical protein
MPAARDHHRGLARRKRPAQQPEDRPATEDADDGHVGDVEAERGQAAVGEQHGLDEQDHGNADGAGPRADQHRGKDPAEQMPAGAGGHREVEHLDREDVGGDQPGQRRLPLLERLGGAGQAHADTAAGHDAGAQRGGGVDEAVGYVHVPSDPARLVATRLHL